MAWGPVLAPWARWSMVAGIQSWTAGGHCPGGAPWGGWSRAGLGSHPPVAGAWVGSAKDG